MINGDRLLLRNLAVFIAVALFVVLVAAPLAGYFAELVDESNAIQRDVQ
jgi:hypothetical protein